MPSDDESTNRRSVSRRSGEIDYLDNAKYMPKLDENGKYCKYIDAFKLQYYVRNFYSL